MKINKREFVIGLGLSGIFANNAIAKSFFGGNKYQTTFEKIWSNINLNYCYFAQKKTNWVDAKNKYYKKIAKAKNNDEFKIIIAQFLRELYDAHTNVHNMPKGSERFPYFDIYAKKYNNDYIIEALRDDSAASFCGLKQGQKIIAIDGVSIDKMVRKYLPTCLNDYDINAEEFALNQALSGKISTPRKITIEENGTKTEYILPLYSVTPPKDIEYKIIENNIGYVAIHSFGTDAIATEFAESMAQFKDTKGLIIDVRYNGGGDTAVARPIMGWFTQSKKPYALMNERKGDTMSEKWTEYVEPNGDYTYTKPVVVLCNHWSASMAEGFPMGMKAVCGAKIIGTKTMGLGAAVTTENFAKNSKDVDLEFQYSYQPVYDINGTPREELLPDIIIKNNDNFIAAAIGAII